MKHWMLANTMIAVTALAVAVSAFAGAEAHARSQVASQITVDVACGSRLPALLYQRAGTYAAADHTHEGQKAPVEHLRVGDQDVRKIGADRPLYSFSTSPSYHQDLDALAEDISQFPEHSHKLIALIVRQRFHGVDHQGMAALAGKALHHRNASLIASLGGKD